MSDSINASTPIINIDNVIIGNSISVPEATAEQSIYAAYGLFPDSTVSIISSLYPPVECGNWVLNAPAHTDIFQCKYNIVAADTNTFLDASSSAADVWHDNGINIVMRCNTPSALERKFSELGTIVFELTVREKINIDNYVTVSGQMSIVPQINLGA